MKVWDKVKNISKIIIILSTIFLLTSCSGVVPETNLPTSEQENILTDSLTPEIESKSDSTSVYLEVPYQKYAGTNWCLPATASMTLSYFGLPMTQQALAKEIIKPDGLGDIYKMVKLAENLGFNSSFTALTIEEIEDYLSNDIPIIAIQEYKDNNPLAHARVVIGFDADKKEIISNDPTIGKDYTMSYEEFMNLNLTANSKYCMSIVITPNYI